MKFQRCVICDYTEEDGSFLSDKPPTKTVRVINWRGDFYCTDCVESIYDATPRNEE